MLVYFDTHSRLIENTRSDITTTYEYNELGQITELVTRNPQKKIMEFTYQYNTIGNITKEIRDEGDQTDTREYVYDLANQLTDFTDNEYTESYSYDNVCNMGEKIVNGNNTAMTYNAGNQLIVEVTGTEKSDYTYNMNGDLIAKSSGEKYTYDIQGNLTAIKGNSIDQSFTYNGSGNRLSETTDGETTYFVNDLNQAYEQVVQTYGENGEVINTYTYGVQRISSVGKDNEVYLYDGRGSVVGSVENEILTSYSYTAYGELMPSSPEPKVFGFNAEATDYTTGLQYLRTRYYDTSINRFFQEDDYKGSYTEPLTMHRYIYVGNNPINRIDPSGYFYYYGNQQISSYSSPKTARTYTPELLYGGGLNGDEDGVQTAGSGLDNNNICDDDSKSLDERIPYAIGALNELNDLDLLSWYLSNPGSNIYSNEELIEWMKSENAQEVLAGWMNYDKEKETYSFANNAVQRKAFGYADIFDFFAPAMGVDITELIIEFEYEGNPNKLELWAGQYGPSPGAEVGYYIDVESENEIWEGFKDLLGIYEAVDEKDFLNIEFTVKDNTNKKIIVESVVDIKTGWDCAIKPEVYENHIDTTIGNYEMVTTIELKDKEMSDALQTGTMRAAFGDKMTFDKYIGEGNYRVREEGEENNKKYYLEIIWNGTEK